MGNEEIKITNYELRRTKDLKIKIHQPYQLTASRICNPFERSIDPRRGFGTMICTPHYQPLRGFCSSLRAVEDPRRGFTNGYRFRPYN